ncbi:GNAT family N-acetyltransferase [Paraburkholderia sp.]|uniref:GNAT family N-acetyltransferase n=1 Tax=Paraburkholderia sp. TaxID=1926495 RepID=UPI0023829DC3|nr:GNAT family N-acetyltransferase [Paraburkholderia sp.]MDE1181080.1 GNAT family N-acetyltransferase [Paraburkholderia sp.]
MQQAFGVSFRIAGPRDVQTVRDVEYDAAQRFVDVGMTGIATAPPMDEDFVRRRIDAAQVIVAVDDAGRVGGFVMFARVSGEGSNPASDHVPDDARIYIEELDVLTAWAGRGIGALLIERVAERACAEGTGRLVLSTFRDVPWNAPYYRRLGFATLDDAQLDADMMARRKRHAAQGLDVSKRVFMVKVLNEPDAA